MASREISKVRNKHLVEFGTGGIDIWCVYLTRPGKQRYAPTDKEYFAILQSLGDKHGLQKVYDDFIEIYSLTSKNMDVKALDLIARLADTYDSDAEEVEIWFTVLYAGMIAEENKRKTRLGKRIKRLGVQQTLIDKLKPEEAANFSRGKHWTILNKLMISKGF
jgi:hypothetical protein